jgi:hypothetical protein
MQAKPSQQQHCTNCDGKMQTQQAHPERTGHLKHFFQCRLMEYTERFIFFIIFPSGSNKLSPPEAKYQV